MSARRALARVAGVLALAACASGYDAYRAAHPEWDGAFPTAGVGLDRTLAALSGPRGRGYTVTVQVLQVWRLEGADWLPVATPRDAVPAGTYAVVASLDCEAVDGQSRFMAAQNNWYLLPDGKLAAWDHHQFALGCASSDDFAPAKSARAAEEQRLLERAGLCRPTCALDAREYYGKGQAYARAGRLEEAREMLDQGDHAGTAEWGVRQRFSDSRGAQHTSDAAVEAAREALVRALASAGQ